MLYMPDLTVAKHEIADTYRHVRGKNEKHMFCFSLTGVTATDVGTRANARAGTGWTNPSQTRMGRQAPTEKGPATSAKWEGEEESGAKDNNN